MLSEKTLVPLSLIIVIATGIYKFTTTEAHTEENSRQIAVTQQRQDEYNKNLSEINTRLSRIEGALLNK